MMNKNKKLVKLAVTGFLTTMLALNHNTNDIYADNAMNSKDIVINSISDSEYKITCNLNTVASVERILFPTLAINNDGNDIIWDKGTLVGKTVEYIVKVDETNKNNSETDTDDSTDNGSTITLKNENITIADSDLVKSAEIKDITEFGYTIVVKLSTIDDIDAVLFPTWTENDGQDDANWGIGKIVGNTVTYRVNTVDHNNDMGTYITHVYLKCADDTLKYATGKSVNISAGTENENYDIQVLDATSDGYNMTVEANNPDDLNYIIFETWTEAGGKENAILGRGTVEDGKLNYRARTITHNNEYGTYYTNVYYRHTDGTKDLIGRQIVTVPEKIEETASQTTAAATNSTENETFERLSIELDAISAEQESGNTNQSANNNSTAVATQAAVDTSDPNYARRSSIVNYAKQFLGRPYVYGGSDLMNGTDCSGFTLRIYQNAGISLPRTSGEQAGAGRAISISELKVGDLVFYARDGVNINHVGIYIGNGQIIHAANAQLGICISSINYNTPVKCVTYIN